MHRRDKAYKIFLLWLLFYFITIEAPVYASENNTLVHLSVIQAGNKSTEDEINDYNDKSVLSPVQYDKNDFKSYYNDRRLKYPEGNQPAGSFLKKLLSFIYKVFRPVIENKATPILFYIAVISVTVLILIWFLRRNIEPVWQREGHESGILHNIDETALIDTDFDMMLQREIAAGNYNNAVRLLFLQTLQKLARQGFIKWENEKTNYDYLIEIKAKIPGYAFNELLYIYEHCWYGNQMVDNTGFKTINTKFSEFQQRLNA